MKVTVLLSEQAYVKPSDLAARYGGRVSQAAVQKSRPPFFRMRTFLCSRLLPVTMIHCEPPSPRSKPDPHSGRRFGTVKPIRRDIVRRTTEAYADHARTYLRLWEHSRRQPRLLMESLKLLPRAAVILDLGCGAGQDSRSLQRLGYRMTGLDLTMPFLLAAHRLEPLLPLIQADVRRLPLRAESFDGIWAAASLIHLSKRAVRQTLVDAKTVVKPGGILAATFLHGCRSDFLKSGWIPGRYVSRWHRSELGRTIEGTGWHVLDLRTVANRERRGRWLNLIAKRPN